ncbi:putative protein kinase RLK-Pelle-SD-2b family [Helianthus annuus]|nr:putative protein kinase RLK-Pelle-SD-2b family [Helianthus annuus]
MRVFTWEKRLKICIDVAHALNYLHYGIQGQRKIINRTIKSDNIGLDENQSAKISDFGLSIFLPLNPKDDSLNPNMMFDTNSYRDPKFEKIDTLKKESDVYSFGIVLFEILCGRTSNDPIYLKEGDKGLADVARRCYRSKTLKGLIDPIIKEEIGENNFVLNKRPNKDPLHIFIEIANQCVKENQDQRPTMKVVVKELEKALFFQKNNPKISMKDIKLATHNFHSDNCIGEGGFGKVYKGELQYALINGKNNSCASFKFWEYKHENIIGLVGYCDELDEKIIVSEYASRGSLDSYLNDASLTWVQRLNICIDIARALEFIHGGVGKQEKVIHRDIKTANVLLNVDWKAKLADFGLSLISPLVQETDYVIDLPCGTLGYLDPLYRTSGFLTIKSDIYSFGVVLFEMLCGRSTFEIHKHERHYLPDFIKSKFEENKHAEVVFEKIREQIVPKSLMTFQRIAYRCLHNEREERPTTKEVLTELKKTLGFQTYRPIAHLETRRKEIKRQLGHLEIRLEDIIHATNNFADKNLINEGGIGEKYYKGQMLRSGRFIDICARRLSCKYGHGDLEFQTEISILSSLKHKNIISLIGFCDEADEKILIYEYAVHGSLDQHLSSPNLTWFQRLKVCLGVAKGLSYMHSDVIHCDINCSKMFLDKDWESKISGFELSTKYPQSWRHRLLITNSFNNTNITITPKYDVYCFGALLFEVLYGRKPMKTEDGVKLEPDDIINPDLREQMNSQSLTDFTKITYMCLNIHPEQRPTMGQIVKDLEDMFELQSKRENLEHTKAAEESTSSNLPKMDWLKIPLSKIKVATNNFGNEHFVAFGGFGSVYKAELDVADLENLSSIEGESPKLIRKTVAIKRINNRQDSEQGFLTEIELLTSCKHPNIISLLGFCMEAREIILVYEYATKGSLSNYLGSQRNVNLNWAKRIQICLDIAHGINYLHTDTEAKPRIIHRDIKSENILLDENLNAKVADFGLSKFKFTGQQARTIHTRYIAREVYMDPEYMTSGKYKSASDVYSFGVVLFEMLSGRMASDPIYTEEKAMGLAPIARRHFNEGTLKEIIDPKMVEEEDERIVTLNRGPNQESFEAFSKIAYKCLAETQARRPTIEVVMKELQTALNLQGETIVLSRFRLSDILVATKNFSDTYCIGLHDNCKVYKGELDDYENKTLLAFKDKNEREWPKARINVAIKRISNGVDAKEWFLLEIEMRTSHKHPNIVSLIRAGP